MKKTPEFISKWSQRIFIEPKPLQNVVLSSDGIDSLQKWGSSTRPPSNHKRVFIKGKRILSILGFVIWVRNGGWVFMHHKAYHPGWAMSWSLNFIMNVLTGAGFYRAVRINAKSR